LINQVHKFQFAKSKIGLTDCSTGRQPASRLAAC